MNDHTTIPTKCCTKCGKKLPSTSEYFYREKSHSDGLRSWCKTCDRERERKYLAANRERRRQSYQDWYLANRERVIQVKREYRIANREIISMRKHLYYMANRERLNKQHRAYQAENRERYRVIGHNYRARQRSLPNDFTAEQQQFALEYFNNTCAFCGNQFYDLFGDRYLSFDHFIPLTDERCPGTTVGNMLPTCHGKDGCNNSKSTFDPEVWLMRRFGKRKAREILAKIDEYFDAARTRFSRDEERRHVLRRGHDGD